MSMDVIGNIASIFAATGTAIGLYIAYSQLKVAKLGSMRRALAVSLESSSSVNGQRRVEFELEAVGPGSFYDLSIYAHYGNAWTPLMKARPEFDRSCGKISRTVAIPESHLEKAEIVMKWAVGGKTSEGLDDRLSKVSVKTRERYIWHLKKSSSLIDWWNRRVKQVCHDKHPLVRPVGRWHSMPNTVFSERSHPGWPHL